MSKEVGEGPDHNGQEGYNVALPVAPTLPLIPPTPEALGVTDVTELSSSARRALRRSLERGDAGPDMSTEKESTRVEAAEVAITNMKHNGSISGQLWEWGATTPPMSRNASKHGGNAFFVDEEPKDDKAVAEQKQMEKEEQEDRLRGMSEPVISNAAASAMRANVELGAAPADEGQNPLENSGIIKPVALRPTPSGQPPSPPLDGSLISPSAARVRRQSKEAESEGPDTSAFQEMSRAACLKQMADDKMASMTKEGSIGAQMFEWAATTPPKSQNSSLNPSRNASTHGGDLWKWDAASPPVSRNASTHGGNLWKWDAASPPKSREGSKHGGDAFAVEWQKMKMEQRIEEMNLVVKSNEKSK